MQKIRYKAGRDCAYNSWDELFANTKIVTIEVLNTGQIRDKKSNIMNLDNKVGRALPTGNSWFSIKMVIVRHPENGIYLLDTGLDSSFQNCKTGKIKGLLKHKFVKGTQPSGKSIAEYLGSEIDNIRGVFYTHLHYDHIAGTADLPVVDLYLSGAGEKVDKYPFSFDNHYLAKIDSMNQLYFNDYSGIAPFDGIFDVLGDRSIWAIATSGHTKGHLSFLMRTKQGMVFFCW